MDVSMRVLLDTNIVIHREARTVINEDIGVLFRWLDNLGYTKCIHPVTADELLNHGDEKTVKSLGIKLQNYNVLKTQAPMTPEMEALSADRDLSDNDLNDSRILNELVAGRVDVLISEDKGIHQKADFLGVGYKAFSIDAFLEKVNAENPELVDYRVLSVRKELFGNINVADSFFDTLRDDYPDFDTWYNRKADEPAYVCQSDDGSLLAFLYLKQEGHDEDYSDIRPMLPPMKRLKIGTLKVGLNGFRLGERFLKIVFDNALRLRVDEVYVTVYDRTLEEQRLITLFESFGFEYHGLKNGEEKVYRRSLAPAADTACPKRTFPFFSGRTRKFIVPIYPQYHTELFPDSILRTESPDDFVENEPHRNAISKAYICRSLERGLQTGDVIVFYRTGGYYRSVVTTLAIVESVIDNIPDEDAFLQLCRKRTVFSAEELSEHWNYRPRNRPFIVNILYACSFPKRINMKRLIEVGVIPDVESAPRGFEQLTDDKLQTILSECQVDESLIVN